jgi:hypothetical protein
MFKFEAPTEAEEAYQLSDEIGRLNDIDSLREFYKEIESGSGPRERKLKLQCKLKIRCLERDMKKDKFIF